MDAIISFFTFLQGLGVSVMMPIIITIIGCCLGAGFGKSLKAGLMVGVGFIGLTLVSNQLFGTSIGPAVQEMIHRFGLQLSTIDVGWPAGAAIALGTTVGLVIIPLALIVNLILVLANLTQTVNVDIWNYWHYAFVGSLVANITGNITFGFAAAIIDETILLVLADATAKDCQKALNMPGVSISQGFSLAYAPVAWVLNWVIDHIPGVRDIDIDVESMQKKFGIFGEPLFIGTVIGLIIGAIAYFDGSDIAGSITSILTCGVTLGAVLVLIPRMASLLMEGLLPVSDAASDFVEKKFSNRGKIYIGLDSAVGVGHPVTLAISFVLVPLCIFLAVLLPGNTVLPFADLAVVPWMFVLITPCVHNNGFRGIIIGIIVLTIGLYIATDLAPLITTAAANVQFDMGGAAQISSICDGANPLTWVIVRASSFLGVAGLGIAAVVAIILAVWNRKRILKEAAELHEAEAQESAE